MRFEWNNFTGVRMTNKYFIIKYFILLIFISLIQQPVYSQCFVNLGNDTVYCGYPFVLSAGSGYETYEWQNGSTSSTFTVGATGTYSVEVSTTGANVVNNGDFELGNVGFTCGYLYATNLWPEGTYWVGANANTVHSNFVGTDHTPPPGVKFLVVNGAALPGTNVWAQSIVVTPNTDYKFSTWVCSVTPSNPATLQFKINGVQLGTAFNAPPATNTWLQFYIIWNSGANTTANISIVNQNVVLSGNDFGIDDITFKPIILCSDSIVISSSSLTGSAIGTDADCYGQATGSADLTVSGGYQPYSYNWDNNYFTQDLNNIAAGVYAVTVTDLANCSVSTSVTVSQPASAVWASLVTSPVSCFGGNDGSIDLSSGGGTGPYTYHWNTGQNSEDLINVPANSFTVTVSDSNGCQKVETVSVGQPDLLSVILQGNSLSCHGDTDAFANPVISGGVLPYSYSWNTGANTSGITNLSAGQYSVTITDNNGCMADANIAFDEPEPIYLYSSADQTICLSQNANIVTNAFGGTLPYTYYWNPGGYGTSSINVSPYMSTEYCVYISDANHCLSNQRCVTINVNPPLQLDLSLDNDSICIGDTITLSSFVTGGNGGPYFLEMFQGPIIDEQEKLIPESSRKYIVIAYDGCGTPTVSDTASVFVSNPPVVSFRSNKIAGCEPFEVQFELITEQPGSDFFWEFNDGSFFDNAVVEAPVHIFNNPGIFDVKLSITNEGGCSRDLTIPGMITVFEKPVSIFESDPQTASIIDPVINYYNFSLNGTDFFWNFGDGDSIWIEQPPEHHFDAVGEYLTSMIAVTDKGCRDTTYQWIKITDYHSFYIPNAFNPFSSVDENRVFKPLGNGIAIEEYKFYIFDRWGELIFISKSFEIGWNGTTGNNKLSPSGNYTYKVTYKDLQGNSHSETGNVMLVY